MEDLKKKYPKEFECYERYKKLNGYNYCEGLEDVFGLMAAFAQEQGKLFDLADVVGRSEQLKAFADFLFDKEYLVRRSVDEVIEEFEKSI